MPEPQTIERAREDAREGKSPSTQAGEFVREEIHHVREGKHGARSPQQAIAIGLSKARRAGVKLSAPSGPSSLRKKQCKMNGLENTGVRKFRRPARERPKLRCGASLASRPISKLSLAKRKLRRQSAERGLAAERLPRPPAPGRLRPDCKARPST